jgi:hypothetical protein
MQDLPATRRVAGAAPKACADVTPRTNGMTSAR